MSKELGEKLKTLRSKNGFTQQHIASQLNVDRSTYSNYERAVTEPDIKTLLLLAKVFNIEVGQLLSDEKKFRVADNGGLPTCNLEKDEKAYLLRFRCLNAEQRKMTLDFMEQFLIVDE